MAGTQAVGDGIAPDGEEPVQLTGDLGSMGSPSGRSEVPGANRYSFVNNI